MASGFRLRTVIMMNKIYAQILAENLPQTNEKLPSIKEMVCTSFNETLTRPRG
jgi:hypothetical protein